MMKRVETNVTGTTAKISDILLRFGLLFDELTEIRDILGAIVLDKVAERGSRIILLVQCLIRGCLQTHPYF